VFILFWAHCKKQRQQQFQTSTPSHDHIGRRRPKNTVWERDLEFRRCGQQDTSTDEGKRQ